MRKGRPWLGLMLLASVLTLACNAEAVSAPFAAATPAAEAAVPQAAAAPFAAARQELVDQIEQSGLIDDQRVLAALRAVPRHEFVREAYLAEAYQNRPLPIGEGQTISQPLVVAMMTQTLRLRPGDRVLEIGTGSGYQAAVLAALGAEVFSVEIIPSLAEWAGDNLRRTGYAGVTQAVADGYDGWAEHAPFDAIIVTAAPDHVPQPLVRQLRNGGRMVVPVGPPGFYQTLWLIEQTDGGLRNTNLGPVRFVPFTRG